MTAVSTYLVRSGMSPTATADGLLHYGEPGPDIYAHIKRIRFLTWDWEITAGRTGEPLAYGTAWTRGGADVKAVAAAHRPGIVKAATR